MKFSLFQSLSLLAGLSAALPASDVTVATAFKAPSPRVMSQTTVFSPPANYTTPKVLYARTVELADGTLLATWENYSPEPPMVYYPIFQSKDAGTTWSEISRVEDQVNGWGMRYQPFLYIAPAEIGGYPIGTIFCAGNSIPTNLSSTRIDLYASVDSGYTWDFVSHVAVGGEAIPDDGLTPIWEPFLLYYQGQLVIFYSDQRDPEYGQKLVHQTSTDLHTWTDVVNDVAYADNYYARPGMTTVTQLKNGSYAMTYEFGGAPGFVDYTFAVYYRVADNPLMFNEAVGYPIVATDGTVPQSSPYITWTPAGGAQGTVLVSCGTDEAVYVNQHGAALGTAWIRFETTESVSYTRHLRVFKNHPNYLLIIGGGLLPPSDDNNITMSIMNIGAAIASI